MLLQGVFVPLTCPFSRDGASYVRKLRYNVGRYSLGPAAGLIALPPGGEAAGLTDSEAHTFLGAVADAAARQKVLVTGVERSSVSAALDMIRVAAGAGFDAALLAPPPDWGRLMRGADARELVLFYQVIADNSPLPVILWSDPAAPSLPLPAEIVVSLAQHPNVIGLIDAGLTLERLEAISAGTAAVQRNVTVTTIFEAVTRRMLAGASTDPEDAHAFVRLESLSGGAAATALASAPALKTRTRTVGFQVLSAAALNRLVPLLQAGASGAAPAVAACAPQACFEAYAAWKDGDLPLAEERAARFAVAEPLIEATGAAALKHGCDLNGYFGGAPRLPRLPLKAEQKAELERALAETRN